MAYIATIASRSYRVTPNELTDHKKTLSLDETQYVLDWQQIASLATDEKGGSQQGGRYSMIIEGTSYEVFVRRIFKAGEATSYFYEISFAGEHFEVKVDDERTKLLTSLAQGGAHTSEAIIAAPMPGLVAATLLEPGASVVPGQPVVVLEAMKMENDLSSPIAGVIKELHVQKGQTVDQGEVLAVITAQ